MSRGRDLDRTAISREIAKRAQMATLDLDILDELCQTMTTRNAVVLTDELVQRRRMLRFGDPVTLVIESLEHLNDMGWVTYLEGAYRVPTRIRVTPMGYHVAGYPILYREASRFGWRHRGRDRDHALSHPGDRTNYLTHEGHAEGGPIETMDIVSHLEFYPDHYDLHIQALVEFNRERRSDMANSLREAIIDGVFDYPNGKPTLEDIFQAIKHTQPMTMNDVTKTVWNLQKTGELKFKERKGQSGSNGEHHGGDLVDIELTTFGTRTVQKRRGLEQDTAPHDRPFITVTEEELLAGTGMLPIEPPKKPEREKVEITDRLTAWKEPEPEKIVAAEILAEQIGGRVVEDRGSMRDPWDHGERGVQMRRPYSTVTDIGRHPVGKDMTDAKNHGAKAKGGPVTRERVAPVPAETQQDASAAQAQREATQAQEEQEDIERTSESPSPMTGFETRFPLIWSVVNREQKAMAAAELLEQAGMPDLAIQAMEQISYTDFEKEVVQLVKELRG